jgi:hypothetical protein
MGRPVVAKSSGHPVLIIFVCGQPHHLHSAHRARFAVRQGYLGHLSRCVRPVLQHHQESIHSHPVHRGNYPLGATVSTVPTCKLSVQILGGAAVGLQAEAL